MRNRSSWDPAVHPRSGARPRPAGSPRTIVERIRTISRRLGLAGAETSSTYPGHDAFIWLGDQTRDPPERRTNSSREIRREEVELDRVLATVLFTDHRRDRLRRPASMRRSCQWQRPHRTASTPPVRAHCSIGSAESQVDTAGDGFFATFDGPARAIRCARTIIDGRRRWASMFVPGFHTGRGRDRSTARSVGLTVQIGARVGARRLNPSADPGLADREGPRCRLRPGTRGRWRT